MKNIWLMGGFGNVLFQILMYRYIKKEGMNPNYVNVLTKENVFTKILRWRIHEAMYLDLIENEQVIKTSFIETCYVLFFLFLSKRFNFNTKIACFCSGEDLQAIKDVKNVFGYFQSKKFLCENMAMFNDLCNEIRDKYKSKESFIVVHYRYGDSVWARQYEKYYTSIKELIKKENEKVLIATDSPNKALEFFSECENVELTNAVDSREDFQYMISAKKLYCAPSTFSWWAAHSLDNDSLVVMPGFFMNSLGIYIKEENLTVIN